MDRLIGLAFVCYVSALVIDTIVSIVNGGSIRGNVIAALVTIALICGAQVKMRKG